MKKTAFYQQHQELKAHMMPFAGFNMPLNYTKGIIKEHQWVRAHTGLFDVSHMLQCTLSGATAQQTLEYVTPTDFSQIQLLQSKYTVLLNKNGGIVDDCIVTKIDDTAFSIVFNAAQAELAFNWLQQQTKAVLEKAPQGSPLLALQGPTSAEVLQTLTPEVIIKDLKPMHGLKTRIMGKEVHITRTGYTGGDGFEFALDHTIAQDVWHTLLQHQEVAPIGLGARDTLRLEAGFPLYGQDLNENTTPVMASLDWVIRKDGKPFLGADHIYAQQHNHPPKKRIGVCLREQGIARANTPILHTDGTPIGMLTSGGLCPSTNQSIGQGYVKHSYAHIGNTVLLQVRNKQLKAQLCPLKFLNTAPTSV